MKIDTAEMTPDDKAKTAKLRDKIALVKQTMARLKNQARPGMSLSARAKQRQAMYNLSHKKLVLENQILVLQGKKPRVLKKRTINNGPHKITHTYIEVQPRVRKPKPENAGEERMSVSQKLEEAAKKAPGQDLWVQARKNILGAAEAEYQDVIEAAHKFAHKHGGSTAGTDVLKFVLDKSNELSKEHSRLLDERDKPGPAATKTLEEIAANLKKFGFKKLSNVGGAQAGWQRGSKRTVLISVYQRSGKFTVELYASSLKPTQYSGVLGMQSMKSKIAMFAKPVSKRKMISALKLKPRPTA